jgi:hypothetical protein
MSSIFKKSAMLALGAAVFVGSFAWDIRIRSIADSGLISPAQARVGRPLTPVSYAGVARRTTRRAVVATSAVAAQPVVVAAPTTTVVVAPTTQTCVDTVNPDGTVTRTCR